MTLPSGLRPLVEQARLELVPMAGLDRAIEQLPPSSHITVTCSPVKGIGTTLDITERLLSLGHVVVPHVAARLVLDQRTTRELAARIEDLGLSEVFVVAGDASEPTGEYAEVVPFLTDFLNHRGPTLAAIGVTAYPGGHPAASDVALLDALRAKQSLLARHGLAGHMTSQICFESPQILRWLEVVRAEAIAMPLYLGLAGPLHTAQLLKVGARIGVGTSLRYLRKNRGLVGMVGPGRYDPAGLLFDVADRLDELDIVGLHLNSFNQVKPVLAWQTELLSQVR